MPILNYSTTVDCYKTISEIQQILTKANATKIIVDNKNGLPVGLTFSINWNDQLVCFALPCNYQGVLAELKRTRGVPKKFLNDEQALRISWRILKDWVAAQLAIVAANLATLPQVFLPYAIHKNGNTLYENIAQNKNQLLLT